MGDTLRSQTISTRLQEIADQAIRYPDMVFTTLAHLIDVDLLREAFNLTNKNTSPGIDRVTAEQYAENLEENLSDLHERLRTKRYVAPPVERVWIDEGETKRPIGMPTFEDKIVQRAVAMLMSAIYEKEFYKFSHGYRLEHSPHQALHELRESCMNMNINWIVDADVQGFFDNLNRGYLRDFIKQRINDGGIIRLIGKWLNAGVLEEGKLSHPDKGTPQGGVISPLLANIFLHYVLDDWFEQEIKPLLKGRCFLIRFADDFVIGCELEEDANRVMAVLPKRFGRYDLTIHPEKTVMVKFGKPRGRKKEDNDNQTFDFLGFTHYWAKSRRGYWVIKRKTARKKIRRFLKRVWLWCRNNRHDPLSDQHQILSSKLAGHYQYYSIRCNYESLNKVYQMVLRSWKYWLSRRSHKGYINWDKYLDSILCKMPLPTPKILHNI